MSAKSLKNRIFVAATAAAMFFSPAASGREIAPLGAIAVAELPVEARSTLVLIKQGGPFPYRKDGAVFGNYEKTLPRQKRGYYHEFTVQTPGVRDRGARRIIVGGETMLSHEHYYTVDHYATFQRIKE